MTPRKLPIDPHVNRNLTTPNTSMVTSEAIATDLLAKGYELDREPKDIKRPAISKDGVACHKQLHSTIRVIAYIDVDWELFWGETGAAAQSNVSERSPWAKNETAKPTLWMAMIRALETAPEGVDIEIRYTSEWQNTPYPITSMMTASYVGKWQSNGWVTRAGDPVCYQDLIKYLIACEEMRTGNVFYVYDEQSNLPGFKKAAYLANEGACSELPTTRRWCLPSSVACDRRFQSSTESEYKKAYKRQRREHSQLPKAWCANSHSRAETSIDSLASEESPESASPRDSATSDGENVKTTDELADAFTSMTLSVSARLEVSSPRTSPPRRS